jgi:hypothetical protein
MNWFPLLTSNLNCQFSTDWLVPLTLMSSRQIQQITPLPTIHLLFCDIAIDVDSHRTPFPTVLPLVTLCGMTYSIVAAVCYNLVMDISSDKPILAYSRFATTFLYNICMKDFLFSQYSNECVQVLLYNSIIHSPAYMEALFLFTEDLGNYRKHSGSWPCDNFMQGHNTAYCKLCP